MVGAAWLVLGLAALVVGAELLVRGASGLARRLGVSPLTIGLTVVAFGTSAPELTVSVGAVLEGRDAIAVGNAIGSNTFNVLFILGLAALITPLTVDHKLVRVDVPIMIGVSGAFWLLVLDGRIGRTDAALLALGLLGFTLLTVRLSRSKQATPPPDDARPPGSLPRLLVPAAAGLLLCVLGARLVVGGSVAIAAAAGISDLIVGLTIVAAGTSLPEVATSVVAALRGQRDIAVGNVVGSNIFNLLGILGVAGLLSPDPVTVAPSVLAFDVPVMTGAAVACLPIVFTGLLVRRWEGAVLLGGYTAYVTWLILAATRHDAMQPFSNLMLRVALPLVALLLAASAITAIVRGWRRQRVPNGG